MATFVLSFFPLDVLDEIWDLIESVSEGFPTYSYSFSVYMFSKFEMYNYNLANLYVQQVRNVYLQLLSVRMFRKLEM